MNRNKSVRLTLIFSLGLSLFTLSMEGTAASFDCGKASTRVENFICADSTLSGLDDDLVQAFRMAKAGNSDVTINQRDWLLNVRNRCSTNACLEVAYKDRLKVLRSMNICLVEETDILGSWVREKNGFFEEMMISYDKENKVFYSWLHHRLEMVGNWIFDDCTIKIYGPEKFNFEFKAKKVNNRRLYLFDDETDKILIYKKIN